MITLSDPVITVNSIEVQDKINKALKIKGISKAIVSTVQKYTSDASVIITTTSDYIAKDLLQHQNT